MAEADRPPENQVDQKPPLMGYANSEELVRAKAASDAEAKRMYAKIQELEQAVNVLENSNRPQSDPWTRLTDLGIPADDLRQVVKSSIGEFLEPVTKTYQARENVIRRNPDYAKYEPQVNRWLADNPELSQQYYRDLAAAPETAMEWAFGRYTLEKRRERREKDVPDSNDGYDQMAIPNGQAAASRGAEVKGPTKEEFEQAIAYGKQYNDWGPFMKLRSRGTSFEKPPT